MDPSSLAASAEVVDSDEDANACYCPNAPRETAFPELLECRELGEVLDVVE